MSDKNKNNSGKVYYGKTRYIDKDQKPRRRYVVVNDNGVNVQVSKLTSIKEVDKNGNNIKLSVVEIKPTYHGLTSRTGVFERRYNKNRITNEKLRLGKDNGVFDEKEVFVLDDDDFQKVINLIRSKNRSRKNEKKGKP